MKLTTRLCSFLTRNRSNSPHRRPDRGDSGYALMVMLIAVTVMTIGLLVVLPSTYQEARREREEELLFRGNQYAQAIYLFQKHFNRYPNSVKELLHTDNLSFLRKPWPDPITPGGKWRFIHASGTGAVLDSWTLSPALGASPLGQNGQNGQNGVNSMNGTNGPNGSGGGFGAGQSGFGNSSSFGGSSGFGGSNSTSSASGGFLGGGGNSVAAGSTSQNDFGWPPSSTGPAQSDAGQQGASWDASSSPAQVNAGAGLPGASGSTPAGAASSVDSLSPAALRADEPGRPLDENGKPKKSPDCMGGNPNSGSSASSSTSASNSSSSSSASSSSFSSSSSFGSQGSSGSSGFLSSSPSSSSFGSGGQSGGPIGTAVVGIASCSDQASLRTYNKHHRYSEWEFIGVNYNPLGSGASTTPVQGPGQPGMQGSGQQGQGSSSGFGSSGTPSQPGQTGSAGSAGSQPGNAGQTPTPPQPAPTPPDAPPDQPQGP
jgi:type II secretory pathway pseudopilin PulG